MTTQSERVPGVTKYDHPILFTVAEVRATFAGKKTQARRLISPQPSAYVPPPNIHPTKLSAAYFDMYDRGPHWCWWTPDDRQGPDWILCPFGIWGDRLWVRETWWQPAAESGGEIVYEADFESGADEEECRALGMQRRSSICLPHKHARLILTISSIRAQRLQEITVEDCIAEGLSTHLREHDACVDLKRQYAERWGATWERNPWVWAVTFQRRQP